MLFKNKDKKEMMSKDDAIDLIGSWAEMLIIDPDSDKFKDVVAVIQYSVRNDKLSFNEQDQTFTYVLSSPIKKQDDSESISIVTISELSMEQKKVVQKYKDTESVSQATALLAESLGMVDKLGFVGRIKGRDADVIHAVIMGFFTGAGN